CPPAEGCLVTTMNALRSSLLLACAALLGCCAASVAQAVAPAAPADAPSAIATDRPSVATGPVLVPVHTLQFENGIGWTRDQGLNTGDAPETGVRYGLNSRVELEAFVPNLLFGAGISGAHAGDLSLGAKVRIGSETQT